MYEDEQLRCASGVQVREGVGEQDSPRPGIRKQIMDVRDWYQQRQQKVTEEVVQSFEDNLRIGLPTNHCCALADISVETFMRWMKFGKEYVHGEDTSRESGPDYARFYLAVTRAQAAWVRKKVERLDGERYDPNWVRDTTLLERRDRSNYGRQDNQSGRYGNADPDMRFL